MNLMDELNEQHYRCTCMSHSISVSRFLELDAVEIEVWLSANTGNQWHRLQNRIRDAWRVLVKGSIPVHGIMLEPNQAEKMGRKLIALAEEIKQEE